MATTMTQQQAAIVTVIPGHQEINGYSRGSAFKLGIAQIACGNLALLFAVMAIIVDAEMNFLGTGIWCGSVFIIAGIFGIISSKSNGTTCHIIAFMVLSIISAIFALVLMLMSIPGVVFSRMHIQYHQDDPHSRTGLASHILLLILALIEATAAIISSAICCRATCWCCNPRQSQGTVYFYPTPGQNSESPASGQQVHLVSLPFPAGTVYSMPTGGFNVQSLSNNQQPGIGIPVSPDDDMLSTYSAPPSYSQVAGPNRGKDEDNQFHYVPLT